MEQTTFTDLMEHPERMNKESLSQIVEVIKEFPYCSTAHLLLVKNLHSIKSIHYNNQLRVASAYAGDRKRLYRLIMGDEKIKSVTGQVKESVKKASKLDETEYPAKKVAGINKEAGASQDVTSDVAKPVNKAVVSISKEVKQEPATPEEQKIKARVTKPKETAQFNQQDQVPKEPKSTTGKTISSNTVKKGVIKEEVKPESLGSDEKLSDQKEKSEGKKNGASSEKPKKQSFIGWMSYFTSSDKTVQPGRKRSKVKQPVDKSKDPESKKQRQAGLIDKFIEADPRIVPSKEEFFSPIKLARKSVEEHDDIYTETLAGIYLKQGHYTKARIAFEKLSLKYPEKSSYFAARIKEIDELTGGDN